jgi:hypothetical protein
LQQRRLGPALIDGLQRRTIDNIQIHQQEIS